MFEQALRRSSLLCRLLYGGLRAIYEVETPILQADRLAVRTPSRSSRTSTRSISECYLRIATELHAEAPAGGRSSSRVYEIGRQFRNEGMDAVRTTPSSPRLRHTAAFSDVEGMKELADGLHQGRGLHAVSDTLRSSEYQGNTDRLVRCVALASPWPIWSARSLASRCDIDTHSSTRYREILDAKHLEWNEEWGAGKMHVHLCTMNCGGVPDRQPHVRCATIRSRCRRLAKRKPSGEPAR